MIPLAQLQLENFFVEESHVVTNPDFQASCESQPRANALAVDFTEGNHQNLPDGGSRFGARLRLEMNNEPADFKKSAYSVDISLYGVFRLAGNISEDLQMKLKALNAPAMLWSTARGIIAQYTASCPWGRVNLPSVNFIELMQKDSKDRKGKVPALKSKPEKKAQSKPKRKLT